MFSARVAHVTMTVLIIVSKEMTQPSAQKSLTNADPSQSLASFTTRLTSEQLECLSRCAKGNSLRFEAPEIVGALIAGGYAQTGVAGVVTVTLKGQQYLGKHTR